MAVTAVEFPQAMFDTGLFKPYSQIEFNNMRNLDNKSTVHSKPDDNQIERAVNSLSHVLVKHDMHKLVGICLVHNHFTLGKDEMVQIKVDKDNNLNIRGCMSDELKRKEHSSVFYLEAAKIDGEDSFAEGAPVPYMWGFSSVNNAFFTMQFFDGSYTKMSERLQQLAAHPNLGAFLADFIVELKQHGMENDLGLFLHYMDLVGIDESKETLYEITDKETRQQVLFITSKTAVEELMKKNGNENMVYTHWTIHHDAGSNTTWYTSASCCTTH